MRVELYAPEHVSALPLDLLPQAADPVTLLDTTQPVVVGVETCSVVSDLGAVACPVQFLNPDGDDIVTMDVAFIYASVGEWIGSQHESPALITGDMTAGRLAWNISCSLAGENFIGPVEWLITLEDAAGKRSDPFLAAFNCIDG